MNSKSLIAFLLCAAAGAAVLERKEQCLTGALASFAPLSTVPAAASYCSQSFPVAGVTVTATATDFLSVTLTLTETVITTSPTTTTEITTETATDTVTDTTTTTTTSFPTPTVTMKKRGKPGHCNTTKKYPTASATSSASAASSSTSATYSACPYDALLCDLISETPEVQGKVCSCLQQAATATVTASVTETTSLTDIATATMTTITLFTTTATTVTTTTATATATSTVVVPGVCKQPSLSCSPDDRCCTGSCQIPSFSTVPRCCNPAGGYCNLNNPGACCNGICFNDGSNTGNGFCG
ncbi:hypothetical protein MN608_11593 [Microdochium nivale]|nr:hypothetical protein MN608_11593 [Microdochium nivale]